MSSLRSLRALRDQINAAAYGILPVSRGLFIAKRVAHATGMLVSFRLALATSDILVMQFVIGAVALFALESVMQRQSSASAPGPLPEELRTQSTIQLALLEGVLELQSARKRDFPIQQNALLALALISAATVVHPPVDCSARWLITFAVLAALDLLVGTLTEARNEAPEWRRAARAVGAAL